MLDPTNPPADLELRVHERAGGGPTLSSLLTGNSVKVECKVQKFGFSAHAGHNDLVKFATVHTPATGDVLEWRD